MKRRTFISILIAFAVVLPGYTGKIINKKNNPLIGTNKKTIVPNEAVKKNVLLEQFFENLCFTNNKVEEKKLLKEYYQLCLKTAKLRFSSGVHVLLNPCVDLREDGKYNQRNTYKTNDPDISGNLAAVAVRAYRMGGIGLSIKHFLAETSQGKKVNTHFQKVEYSLSGKELAKHLLPYKIIFNNTDCSYIMVGHTIIPKVGGKNMPLSISPIAIKYLREMGFRGIIVSDDFSRMKGVLDFFEGENKQGQAFLAFIKAGGTIAGFMGNREAGKAMDYVLPKIEDGSKDAEELLKKIDAALFLILKDKVRVFGNKWLKDAVKNSSGKSNRELIRDLINTMNNKKKLKEIMWVSFYGNILRDWHGVGGVMLKSKFLKLDVNSNIPVFNITHSTPWERKNEKLLAEKYSKIGKG
ncbi:MAG: glycoside hydrolase family 3 N-terminal domain-containing protein [Acidobacteriota bacterium]